MHDEMYFLLLDDFDTIHDINPMFLHVLYAATREVIDDVVLRIVEDCLDGVGIRNDADDALTLQVGSVPKESCLRDGRYDGRLSRECNLAGACEDLEFSIVRIVVGAEL